MKANTDTIIGNRYGKLIVIKFSHTTTARHKDRIRVKYWFECLCNCGQTVLVSRASLYKDHRGTKSCGCNHIDGWQRSADKQRGVARPHVQKPNGASVLHHVFLAYKGGAKRRNIPFLITEKQFAVITDQRCSYCDCLPKETKSKKDSFSSRKMNGIDSLDNNLGYILSNCVPCCKVCNYMKQELSEKEFFEHIKRIVKFRSLYEEK